MSRTQLSPRRLIETKPTNIGRIIIFCEGETDQYYFDYFAEIINKNKYTDIEVVLETANGNAQTVLNLAKKFMNDEKYNRKYSNYGKYLAFDCDDPSNIQEVIRAAKDYELLISNHFFETWLLMHFEDINTKLTRQAIYNSLSKHLNAEYKKANKGQVREIIQNGSVEKAIDHAKLLEKRYKDEAKSIFTNISEMNPYTSVHTLVEQFMIEISSKAK
ncbi:MAG: RloB family protein [Oscillospiraceae bacterium]|nr:RloB family protein [Oscillospiraceae bacterium]